MIELASISGRVGKLHAEMQPDTGGLTRIDKWMVVCLQVTCKVENRTAAADATADEFLMKIWQCLWA